MTSNVRIGARTLMLLGIILCVLGLIVLLSPVAAGEAVVLIVAVVLVVTGIAQAVQGWRSGGWSVAPIAIVFGAVVAVLGVMVWLNPAIGSGFLTVLLILFFIANGLWKVSTAWRYRGAHGWVWLLLSGVTPAFAACWAIAALVLTSWATSLLALILPAIAGGQVINVYVMRNNLETLANWQIYSPHIYLSIRLAYDPAADAECPCFHSLSSCAEFRLPPSSAYTSTSYRCHWSCQHNSDRSE